MKQISRIAIRRTTIRRTVQLIIVALCTGGAPLALLAQSADNGDSTAPIIIGQSTSISSAVLNEDRPLLIYTPPGYEQSSVSYPVLYLLDGGGHFHHASGVTQFLSANNRMPPMIVVGVPNTGDRTHDLTPPETGPDSTRQFPSAGGGSDFLKFLTDELKPWVESSYRTAAFNILVGHSFGGLFVTQTLMENPGAFEAYISISPALWWDQERYVANAERIFEDNPELDGALYMTMGNEGGRMLAGAWSLTRVLETHAPESFRWKWSHMPEEDHGSVPHRSLYDGLEWLFDGWNLPNAFAIALSEEGDGMTEIDKHYAELSERFKFEVQVPEGFVNQIGYSMLASNRVNDAIRTFEQNAERYAASANVYDSLGDGLDAACRWEEAHESYSRAHKMAVEQAGPNISLYEANMNRIADKMASGEECIIPVPEDGG